MIRMTCPSCNKKLGVDDAMAGKAVKCPACKSPFKIPNNAESHTAPAAAKPAPRPALQKTEAAAKAAPRPAQPTPPEKAVTAAPPRRKAPAPPADAEPAAEMDAAPKKAPSRPVRPALPKGAIAPATARSRPPQPAADEEPPIEVEAEEEAPPKKPASRPVKPLPPKDGIASAPARRRPSEPVADDEPPEEVEAEEVEAEEEEERPRKRRRKKKRYQETEITDRTVFFIFLGVAVGIYLAMTCLALISKPGAFVLMGTGIVLLIIGKFWFMYIARKEDPGVYLLVRFIPFYWIYFFITRIHETYKSFLMSASGVVFLLTWLAVSLVRGYFGYHYDPDHFDGPPPVAFMKPAERQKLAENLLQRADKAEAKAWLKGKAGREVLGMPTEEAIKHVQDLYAKGAKEVLVADIDVTDPTEESAQHMVIVLPDEPDKRRTLFQYLKEMGFDDMDTGQKYVVMN
jgi:hypothetical protein